MTMKKNNPGCCTCGGGPSCTCVIRTCWAPYVGDRDSDVPHPLRCKCLFPDLCPDDLPDLTIDIAGSGTPANDDIPCSTVACDWDGTFVIACNTIEDPWQRYTYICDGIYSGAAVKFYYRHTATFSYSAQGVFVKTIGNRASFEVLVELRSNVVAFPFASPPTVDTWLNAAASGTVISTSAFVRHRFTANSFLEFQRSDIDETDCPTDPCNPYGELVECGTLMTGTVTTDTPGQGCYPDPDDVTVTPSWP